MIKAVVFFSLNLFIIFPSHAEETEQTRTIAIAAEGREMDSSVCAKAARCQYFLLFDEEGEQKGVLDNPHENASRGAGPMTADFLAQKEVTILVAGNVGYKMMDALRANKITHLKFTGTVEKALEYVMEEQR
jgi:predicted Fe-Mo cluster-binding NifX family protein